MSDQRISNKRLDPKAKKKLAAKGRAWRKFRKLKGAVRVIDTRE